ncbi:MAG: hypothetical protein V3T05_03785 [Myxococcota bacterium]
MSSKGERYFSGVPVSNDPSQPLPGEVPPGRKQLFMQVGAGIILVAVGVGFGVVISPESPKKLEEKIVALQGELQTSRAKVAELERSLTYRHVKRAIANGRLKDEDRRRHETQGRKYAHALRMVKAQPAADLMDWFIGQWNGLLDAPQPDDRVGRRAAVLSLLVGGMAENLNPDDFVPWQAEFFLDHKWLGELHFDLDGDGLPAKRTAPNPKDGFANTSVCQIAMALNQSITNAQVMVMSDLHCDRPEARISVFLQGKTLNDALNEFIVALRREGFIVVERKKKSVRLILIGQGTRR